MIPRVARGSTSFDDANNYYLHDKDGELLDREDDPGTAIDKAGNYALHDKNKERTSYRVGFTHTLNLEAEKPADAIREMRERYDAFKDQEHHKRGRKLQKPVYTYSLSWSPDEKPSKEEMLDAARSSLKAMRLEGLQTLIVQHLDEPQPHIHLIVHRIEADGKRARNIPWDHLRFSRWAEQYEREHGKVLCGERERNNAARDLGVFVKDEKSLSRRQYESRQHAPVIHKPREREVPAPPTPLTITAELFSRHVAERERLAETCRADALAREQLARESLRGTWREIFIRQDATTRDLAVANRGGVLERAVFVYRHLPLLERTRSLSTKEIAGLCTSASRLTKSVQQAHREERGEMVRFEQACVSKASAMVHDGYRIQSREMVARQRLESDLLVARLSNEFRPEPQPERPDPPPRVPELRQGEQLGHDTVVSLLSDPVPLSEVFNERSADRPSPPRKPSRSRDCDNDFDRGL